MADDFIPGLTLKRGVVVENLHIEYVKVLPQIINVFNSFGYGATVTSGNEETDEQGNAIEHMEGSFHWTTPLQALDWRTWRNSRGEQMSYDLKLAIVTELRRELPPQFQFEIEATHIHIEFDDR